MTFDERFGNADVPHEEKYGNAVETLGYDALKRIIPWSKETLVAAYAKDKNFNSISIKEWDRVAGYVTSGANVRFIGSPIADLLYKNGITSFSLSQIVCTLKAAARRIVREA